MGVAAIGSLENSTRLGLEWGRGVVVVVVGAPALVVSWVRGVGWGSLGVGVGVGMVRRGLRSLMRRIWVWACSGIE